MGSSLYAGMIIERLIEEQSGIYTKAVSASELISFENQINTADLVIAISQSGETADTLETVKMAREAGAKKVYFASASPPIRHPNVYGIDMPYVDELIAHNRNIEEICKEIGADKLIYQDLNDLITAVREGNKSISEFDTSCFNGEYITGGVSKKYLNNLVATR